MLRVLFDALGTGLILFVAFFAGQMSVEDLDLVEWREEFVSQERGNRVVHYYLEDSSGKSFLAVVGTERSLRHMLYVIADGFSKLLGLDSEGSGSSSLKWRSRREVVDWLTSFLPKRSCQQDYSNSPRNGLTKFPYPNKLVNGLNDQGSYTCKQMDHFNRKFKGYNPDIAWSGAYWICCKQLKHYQAFCRNGTTISSQSFVLVMSEEEENCYLAYVEDMYEDKKGQKKVKVRWFHRHQEVSSAIPPPIPHPKEVFITPYSQVISAECVDDLASILTPEHYEKCLAVLPYALPAGVYICYRQYSKNKFKYFDLSTLYGYFDQTILSCLDIYTVSGGEQEEIHQDGNSKLGSKRIRSLRGRHKFVPSHLGIRLSSDGNQVATCQRAYPNLRFGFTGRKQMAIKPKDTRSRFVSFFKIEDKIESLCQDSGIRGCWFRCTVLQLSQKQLKVRYDDVQNEDGNGNLEEWILAHRPAAQDRLGMRYPGRLTVRPCRPSDDPSENISIDTGTPVDAWWNDGWWEGVVIGVDSCNDEGFQVYFPGEDVALICQRKSLRISKDWIDNQWMDIKAKANVLSSISSVNLGTKLSTTPTLNKSSDSGVSALSEQKDTVEPKREAEETLVADGLTKPQEGVQLENFRKRNREGEIKDSGRQEDGADCSG